MKSVKTTPMIKQYLSIKEDYPDAILFFRMGDFYEMFFEDAEIASRALEITLTSRNKNDATPIPMCGVPHKAVRGYISKMIDNGYKVAICDQLEDPSVAKGIVKRDVTRVITPGMIIDDDMLDEKSNNFLLALSKNNTVIGISYLDLSTGTFRVTESDAFPAVQDEVLSISPSEILLSAELKNDPTFRPLFKALGETPLTFLEDKQFDVSKARKLLEDQFQTMNLKGFGCDHLKAGLSAAGALLFYVRENQKQKIEHFSRIEPYTLNHFMMIDSQSFRNLEITANLQSGTRQGTLIHVMDQTVTAMGARLLKKWIRYPLIDVDEINRRLDAVEEAVQKIHITKKIRENMKSVYDLERLGSKVSMGHANARDLVALKSSIFKLPDIISDLSTFSSSLYRIDKAYETLIPLAELIDRSIREDSPPTIHEGGIIREGYNKELDNLIRISTDGKGWLANLEIKEKDATGIQKLKVKYNKVFGYYIEIPKTQIKSVPPHYVRKQTLVNAERYITDDLKQFESEVLSADERRNALELQLFNEIRDVIIKQNRNIQNIAGTIASLDCLLGIGLAASQNDYTRPQINTDDEIIIEDGRHPVIEKLITGERFVPNSVKLDNQEHQILIITGPNMAGKSTVLRQVALIALMAQMGSFIPAKKASICITDRIFTRVGALDNIAAGQSTFMVEMQETANILNNSTHQSLIILDEIGRGTSTFDGLSIAWAVAEYLHDLKEKGVKTLFATHYHELTDLSLTKERVRNYNIAVKEWNDEIIFLRKLVEGGTNRSYGIQVARLAGIPDDVLKRAKTILSQIEHGNQGVHPRPSRAEKDTPGKKGHMQLDMFRDQESRFIKALQGIDISKMTPLDALNLLNELAQKAKEIS